MTDYLFESYRKRCFKEFRETAEVRGSIPLSEMSNEDITETTVLKKFITCMISPLVPKAIQDQYFNCLKKKDGDITKCPKSWKNFKNKGMIELSELIHLDLPGVYKTKKSVDKCESIVRKSKDLNCATHPERSDCQEMREKAFHCITRASCKELSQMSVKCFKDQQAEDEGGFFYRVATGEDTYSRVRKDENCATIQEDYMNCFEKYYLMTLVTDSDERFKVRVEENPNYTGFRKSDIVSDKTFQEKLFFEKIEESDDE